MQYQLEEDITILDETEAEQQILPVDKGDDSDSNMKTESGEILDVLPLRNMVLFPGVLLPVNVTRPRSQKLVQTAYEKEKLIAVCCQQQKSVQEPSGDDLYRDGTSARVLRVINMPDDTVMVILEGKEKICVDEFTTSRNRQIKARVRVIEEIFPKRGDKQFIAIVANIKEQALKILSNSETAPSDAGMAIRNIDNPYSLVNYVCVNISLKIKDKQQLLAINVIQDRAFQLLEILNKEVQMIEMKADIQSKAKEDIAKDQREYYLHRQMEAIQRELGDTGEQVINDLRARADQMKWNEGVRKAFDDGLKKMQRIPPHSSEYATEQNYLETLLDLPWSVFTEDNYDIKNAQAVLDKDHYGMEKIKERIIEHLAVMKMQSAKKKSPILCLYGPPGVGKTSLGRSIASALGRKYARISLGGLHDEAEIRGHRRTYIGAMPGRIIENIRKVKSSNPVFILDEIDKIGADYKGDPTSALLEVLDPEQNKAFHDNYLGVDYDLSQVMFIATANSLDSIPRPLLDRMELIELTGYLQEEKVEIARHHLLPKELENHAIKASQLRLKKDVLDYIIDGYTRESGVRSLSRQIAAICRKVVTKIALEEPYNVSVTREDVDTYLGKPRFSRDAWETNKYIGVVTGLAWTQVGGEILFIETSLSPSKTPTLTLTGNLGDVMKESATLAMGYIKAHADQFGIPRKSIDTTSVHIHVPEGATPKDGPSAGITITTALVSAFTHRKVRERIAMTGEMTLRGKVLAIGGVKEKILAAKRAGITDLVLCHENQKDVEAIPEKYVKGLRFHYVTDIKEVIDFALL